MRDPGLLKAIFREEAAELIDRMGILVDSLKSGSDSQNQESIIELLRIIHNLKGAARTIGHDIMEALTHRLEEELGDYKKDLTSVPKSVYNQLLEAIAALQIALDEESTSEENIEVSNTDPKTDPKTDTKGEKAPAMQKRAVIRVDTARFDELMGFSGDLLMFRARIEERHRLLRDFAETIEQHLRNQGNRGDGATETIRQMRDIIQVDNRDVIDFGYLTDEITETMKRLRMVPLELAEREWREVVRKVGIATGKTIDVTINTGTIQLDKQVLDQLRDPMMHLLRNAVDHGIEPAWERTKAGKPANGKIEIEASLQGAMVQLMVRDDGKGIDRDKIRNNAVYKGLAEKSQLHRLSDDALLDLLFHPGFSTADKVTEMSGRGVGLDVVRSRIESLCGRVRVWSPPGESGTTFYLSVPLSVVSTVGLHVKSGTTAYALPLEYVQYTIQACDDDIDYMDGHMTLRRPDADPIRLVHLSALVGETQTTTAKPDKVVVLSRSNMLLGVFVDAIEGQYEFVTHSLPWNLEQTPGVSGGSLRPDGTVVVVLDIPFLFDQAGVVSDINKALLQNNSMNLFDRTRRVLVVDDSLASRTMEKNIVLDAGHEVTLAEDGESAWKRLHEESFDLLISDIDMPRLDGLELTRRIRNSDKFRDLPIILVTSLDNPESSAAGAAAGADEYVVKGTFDQRALSEVISRYL